MLRAFKDFRKRLKFTGNWKNPYDLISSVSNSDLITCVKTGESRIVFNVGGNKYRMICGYHIGEKRSLLFVKFIGTHEEYDKVDVCKIDMFKSR